jgi:hypothetical protein
LYHMVRYDACKERESERARARERERARARASERGIGPAVEFRMIR